MTQQLTPRVEVWVEEVEGKHGEKRKYRFRCEQTPIPVPEKKKGLAVLVDGKPERAAVLVSLVIFATWASHLL